MKNKNLRISKKEVRLIKDYLESMNDNIPKEYKGYRGVTEIRYGFMRCSRISVGKIKYIAKELGYDWW